jgi:hypothetical protein
MELKMRHFDWFFAFLCLLFAIMFGCIIFGAWYDYRLKLDCVNSGDIKSQACFKYNVMSDNFRNNNVNLNLKGE